MYEEYDEYFDEPGVVDGIVDAAMMQMHDHLKAEIRHYLADVVSAENRKKNLENEIRQNENRLKNIESRIKETLEKEIDVEKQIMPQKYVDAFVRKVTGDYVVGQKVWIITSIYKSETCPMCNGNKMVAALVGDKQTLVRCPECEGTGMTGKRIRKAEETQIKEICVQLYINHDNKFGVWNTKAFGLRGSDARFEKEYIFPTKEAAEARIRELEQEESNG